MAEDNFEEELERTANEYADSLLPEEVMTNKLLPEQAIRARLVDEFKTACKMETLNQHLSDAVKIICTEGKEFLDTPDWQELEKEMEQAASKVQESAFDPETMDFQEYLGLSNAAIARIEEIARKKYDQPDLQGAVSLYAFLTIIKGTSPVLWYRLGIILQESGDLERALQAYQMTLQLDPSNIGACLFSAECCQDLGKLDDVEERLSYAEELINVKGEQERWGRSLEALKSRKDI